MRILLYNWVQFDDVERRGGGVRLYEENLVNHLVKMPGVEVYTLSSGLEHDFFDRRFRFEPTTNVREPAVRSFTAVNSPVLAPGHHCFGSPKLFDEESLPAWHEFLRQHGPFDVVQFDSLEGIPLTFLRVHEVSPATRVLVYAHNYYSVCPQVNLWKQESEHCDDYHEGRACGDCLVNPTNPNEVLRSYRISRMLRRTGVHPGTRQYRLAYAAFARARRNRFTAGLVRYALKGARSGSSPPRTSPEHVSGPADAGGDPVTPVTPVSLKRSPTFAERRHGSVALINSQADTVLATSHRVAEVLAARGVDRERLEVVYIGTAIAGMVDPELRRQDLTVTDELTIAYLGYMRRDKGFYFLLDALERAPAHLLARLRLVVAAGGALPELIERLKNIGEAMRGVVLYDGYSHDQLPAILRDVDLGVVPVQWEDNLPQVAIEMVAHGVPILTSHRGGARELGGDNPSFVFDATEPASLLGALESVIDGEIKLASYWDDAIRLVTMDAHVDQLCDLYARS